MSYHLFCDRHVVVDLPVVYLKFEADEVREYCGRSSHGFDWYDTLAGLWTDNGETNTLVSLNVSDRRNTIPEPWSCERTARCWDLERFSRIQHFE